MDYSKIEYLKPPFDPYLVRAIVEGVKVYKDPTVDSDVIFTITDLSAIYKVVKYFNGRKAIFGWGYLEELKGWVSLDYFFRV